MKLVCFVVTIVSVISSSGLFALEITTPKLTFAKTFQPESREEDFQIKNHWISEKLDGVRGYWNGKHFISRQGNMIESPEWFTKVLPNVALDGELWMGRGTFEKLSGIVRRKIPSGSDWKNIKYMVFDLPGSDEVFDKRLQELRKIIDQINSDHVKLVDQFKVSSTKVLSAKLDEIVAKGGEGLMLHLGSSHYHSGRTGDLLKFKKFQDAKQL